MLLHFLKLKCSLGASGIQTKNSYPIQLCQFVFVSLQDMDVGCKCWQLRSVSLLGN